MGNTTRRQAKYLTTLTAQQIYDFYLERLINLALSQFEWRGLPRTMDRRYLELKLLMNGTVAIAKPRNYPEIDPGVPPLVNLAWIADAGKFDIYGYPVGIRLVDYLGRQIHTDEYHLLYDNASRVPLISRLKLYAKDLALLHMLYRQNLRQQSTPFVAKGPKKLQATFDALMDEIEDFSLYVAVSSEIDADQFQVLPTNVEFKGLAFLEARQSLWSDALAVLGISSETTKKERLISDEIVINRQEDTVSLNSRLMERVEMANLLNEKYGLEITVNMSDTPALTELDRELAEEAEEEASSHTQDVTVTEKTAPA